MNYRLKKDIERILTIIPTKLKIEKRYDDLLVYNNRLTSDLEKAKINLKKKERDLAQLQQRCNELVQEAATQQLHYNGIIKSLNLDMKNTQIKKQQLQEEYEVLVLNSRRSHLRKEEAYT